MDEPNQSPSKANLTSTRASRRTFLKGLSAGVAVAAVAPSASAEKSIPESFHPAAPGSTEPVDQVNCFQGTNSTRLFSRGNTLPIAAVPFGMAHWTLQTAIASGPWFFHPADQRIEGIRCTHQLSPWLDDYGYATLMPFTGNPSPEPAGRASSYRPSEIVFKPHHIKMALLRYGCVVELVPTERGAMLQFNFDGGDARGLMVDLPGDDAEFHLDRERRVLTGITRKNAGGVPEGFATYYVLHFDQALSGYDEKQLKGRKVGIVSFEIKAGNTVAVRIGTSFISAEQATLNLETEISSKSFDQLFKEAHEIWGTNLGRIKVEGGSDTQQRTFYSSLYRAVLFPRVWHEPDGKGGFHHYSAYNGKVVPGVMYADHGYWDVYRAWYPLMSIIDPKRLAEILQAWVNAAQEGGWLPQFPCPGYRACMTGSLIDSVFGDAAAKNLPGYDVQGAYAALRKHATQKGDPDRGYGRRGIEQYLERGFIPDEDVEQSAVETLDSAYGDFCIAQVARAAGKTEDAGMFEQRSQNWRKVFDAKTGFMRGKHRDGSWLEPFDPLVWGSPYVEGAAWQHRFSVPHDVAGLATALGGTAPLTAAIEEMLRTEPRFKVGVYGQEIHEMSEMAAVHFGQYAQSNQPVHHALYLFALAGRPDRTQFWVRRVLKELFTPENFPGDEDTGSMGAWYVLSALGFYPVCPGRPSYVMGSPLFDRTTLTLDHGKATTIEAQNNNDDHVYVASVTINGARHAGVEITHQTVMEGSKIVFAMTDKAVVD
jgi:predicted alpha-1,2-mannosidase